jgi:hypothetical protein
MTMIAALNLKSWFGQSANDIIIAGDSRVTRTSEATERFESRFDSAQKVIPLSPNILVGFAGDYRVANVLLDLQALLIQRDEKGKEKYKRFAKFLREEIKGYLLANFNKDEWIATDVLIAIQDYDTKKKRLHKLILPDGTFVEMKDGLHLIGSSAQERELFYLRYNQNIELVCNGNINVDSLEAKSIPIRVSFDEIKDEGVGGSIHIFALGNNGWINIGTGTDFGTGNYFVSTALREKRIETQLNGEVIQELTSDWNTIDDKLKKNVKSK